METRKSVFKEFEYAKSGVLVSQDLSYSVKNQIFSDSQTEKATKIWPIHLPSLFHIT